VSEPLLEVTDLCVAFGDKAVVDHVTFTIDRGGRLAIIGESGSGKTLTALSVIGLAPDSATITGRVTFDGQQLVGRSDGELSKLRGARIAMVFQNPQSSLNPLMRVGKQIAEPLRRHRGMDRDAARRAAIELCDRVGLPQPERTARAYPHQLSGGQRQRIGIAIALACRPALLIADEPTTALDVTVQAEVLALLAELITAEGTTLLFITHDIALVPLVADDLMVMRNGRIVEAGPVATIVERPADPYTVELLAAAERTALPVDDGVATGGLALHPGERPALGRVPGLGQGTAGRP
jgi:peptide/nickel transport system ATP-binding protein